MHTIVFSNVPEIDCGLTSVLRASDPDYASSRC